MTEDEQSTAGIGGYVCPTCRLVFTAHVSQLGEQVECPGCQHLVKLPLEGEEEQKLVPRKSKKYVQAGSAASGRARSIRVDRRNPNWERSGEQASEREEPHGLPWAWILPAGLLGLGLFGFLLSMLFSAKPVEPTLVENPDKAPVENEVKDVAVQPTETDVDEYDASIHQDKLEVAITKFLQADSIEELLPTVRRTPGLEAKMKKYYSDHEFDKRDLKSLVTSASLLDNLSVIVFEVRLSDYSTKQGFAQMIDDEIYIDWETFVVYSEMPWSKFEKEKITKPVLVRAVSSPSSYFNYGFKDDEWAAFALTSPVEDMEFIGYVPRNSALQAKLKPIGGTGRLEAILKVKYPEEALSNNQIIIEEVIATKWMIDELEPQK